MCQSNHENLYLSCFFLPTIHQYPELADRAIARNVSISCYKIWPGRVADYNVAHGRGGVFTFPSTDGGIIHQCMTDLKLGRIVDFHGNSARYHALHEKCRHHNEKKI